MRTGAGYRGPGSGFATASLLSRYANAVGLYRETGNPAGLVEFEGRTYRDANGTVHSFPKPTRPRSEVRVRSL